MPITRQHRRRLSPTSSIVVGLLGPVVAVLGAGCVSGAATSDQEAVASRASALAAQDWIAAPTVANGTINYHTASIAFLDGNAYATLTSVTNVSFARRLAGGTWTVPQPLAGVSAIETRLAAFGGRLYLLTQPINETTLFLSRYEPTTDTWTTASQLPFQSAELPGFTAHGGRLVLLGSQPGVTHALWMATMDAAGTFQPAQTTTLGGIGASLASHDGHLHAFYRSWPSGWSTDGYGDVLHASFDGVSWTAAEKISMGFGTTVLRGKPSAASYVAGGFDCLHLTALDENASANVSTVWWTASCGPDGFAVPVSLVAVPLAFADQSLAASPDELLLAHEQLGSTGYGGLDIAARSYRYPRLDGQPCTSNAECSTGVCTTSYVDGDGDGFGAAPALRRCGTRPPGQVAIGGDCCDSDARAWPGQKQYFTEPRTCGGYDFDCSRAEEPQFPPRKFAGCMSTGTCFTGTRVCTGPYWETAGTGPVCGLSAPWRDCKVTKACLSLSECSTLAVRQVKQACR